MQFTELVIENNTKTPLFPGLTEFVVTNLEMVARQFSHSPSWPYKPMVANSSIRLSSLNPYEHTLQLIVWTALTSRKHPSIVILVIMQRALNLPYRQVIISHPVQLLALSWIYYTQLMGPLRGFREHGDKGIFFKGTWELRSEKWGEKGHKDNFGEQGTYEMTILILGDRGTKQMSRSMTQQTKLLMRTAKMQISLGTRPSWSESSLCAKWGATDPRFPYAGNEDWSDWSDAQADLSLHWVHMPFCRATV